MCTFATQNEKIKQIKIEQSDEKNISTPQPQKSEQARFPRENGYEEWPPRIGFTSCERS